jgi:hypothetical protein
MSSEQMSLEVARHYMYRDAIAELNAKLEKAVFGAPREFGCKSAWYAAARLLLVRRKK